MPSNEDEHNDGDTSSDLLQKKHKIQRACDICRRKKSTSAHFSSTPHGLTYVQSDVSE